MSRARTQQSHSGCADMVASEDVLWRSRGRARALATPEKAEAGGAVV